MGIDEELLNILNNANYNNPIINIELDKKIINKLLDYQILNVQQLIHSLNINKISLDTSDTDCGKTYCALALCKQLNLNPIIICPKSIMSNWYKLSIEFNVKPLFICNYETIRNCKYYLNNNFLDRIDCPYLKYDKTEKKYIWKNLSNNNIIIFDEVHFCKCKSTLNGKLLISSKNHKLLLLSATLIDNISSFEIFTYMLNWCKDLRKTKYYLMSETNNYKNFNYLTQKLYPKYASRISIKELGDKFPKNNIIIDSYNDDKNNLINIEYNKIKDYYKKLDDKDNKINKNNLLSNISFSRQKIELYKIEIINDLVNQYINNNYSIVIFVNFQKTLDFLMDILKTDCVIHGKQTHEQRKKNIDDFQENKKNIIISNICAGGQSINLHDKYGKNPRVSLIVPSYSSTQLIQALGRIHRASSKSYCTQRIIFCSGTVEEHICKKLKEKISNLENINDNDLNIFMDI